MSDYLQRLGALSDSGRLRRLRPIDSPDGAHVTVHGRPVVNFSSNDYLALANDPRLIEAAVQATRHWGCGAGASRLITGTLPPHRQLERELAAFKRSEASLVFSTGYMANIAAVRAGAESGDHIFSDALNHASIIDGTRLSGAAIHVFRHRDYDHLEELLRSCPSQGRRLIVTDSLFSMDGDFADLPRLIALKQKYGARLCIDEAHATGVCGANGRGVAEMMQVEGLIDITVGTLSKALGGQGGFICGTQDLIDYLVNTARSFIFSTAILPSACAAAQVALRIVADEPQRRVRVRTLSDRLRDGLRKAGFDLGQSQSYIVPVIVGETRRTLQVADALLDEGILVLPIRPPTVPDGTSRLRISLTSAHTDEEVDTLLTVLNRVLRSN